MRYVALLLVGLGITGATRADCTCACVNGSVQAICSSAIDMKPICGAQLCPLPPTSLQPLTSMHLPPLGTSHCRPKQVFDPNVGQYVWKELCE